MTDDPLTDLIQLFLFQKKKELKQHCKSVAITKADFASFILAATTGSLPWMHQAHHREFVPEHLSLTDEDKMALVTNGVGHLKPPAKKAATKISEIFDKRRLLTGHMFSIPISPIGTFSILTSGISTNGTTIGKRDPIFTSSTSSGLIVPLSRFGMSSVPAIRK